MPEQQQAHPRIHWDGSTWFVALPVDDGRVLEAKWAPGVTYVVRIREKGADEWSCGFQTPVTGCTFTDLKPDTEYEVQVRTRTSRGDSASALLTLRTDPAGGATNVIPFPTQ